MIRILLEQHARFRELFADVHSAEGDHKSHAFDELRALLAVHETGEELVLRPATKSTGTTRLPRRGTRRRPRRFPQILSSCDADKRAMG